MKKGPDFSEPLWWRVVFKAKEELSAVSVQLVHSLHGASERELNSSFFCSTELAGLDLHRAQSADGRDALLGVFEGDDKSVACSEGVIHLESSCQFA